MQDTKQTFELIKNYIDQIPIGILLFNPSLKLISWNKHTLNTLEVSSEDLLKNNLGILENQIKEILTNNEVLECDLIGLLKPFKAKKITLDDKNIILLIMESYQEAIGEMSHELRRPITNIKTLTESLLLGAKNEPEILQKFLENINNEIDRLTKLVNNLLSVSKIRSGKLRPTKQKIKLKSKVNDAIKLLSSLAEKNKIIISNNLSDEYIIFADPEQIDHVIQNLLENAIKYSNEGSSVSVKAGPSPGSFQVDDTGIGIPLLEIPKIFDRFYRVDRTKAKGSSGLGLSIVKNIVDIHGGRIEVKSKPGSGSSFIVYLPVDDNIHTK